MRVADYAGIKFRRLLQPSVNGQSLQAGDGAAMTQQPDLDFMATSDNTEILLFDLA